MPKNKGETGKERVNNGASKKNLENEQWPLAKMFRYAKKRHPRKVTMENKEAIVRSIQKTLDAIGFPKTNGQYVVPRVIGEFIIDDLMAEYFHSAGRRDKRKEEKRKQLFEKYQRESAQEDQNLNEIQEFASYIYSFLRESEVIEEKPEKCPEGILRGGPEGAIRRSPEGAIRRSPEGAIRRSPEGILRRSPEGILRRSPEGILRRSPEGILRGGPEGILRGGPEGILRGGPEGILRGGPEGILRGGPEGILRGGPEGILRGGPEGILRREPEGAFRGSPEESSEEVQKESPQEVLEEIKKDPRVQKEYDEYWNHKSYFEYHIHTPTEEKFFWEDREKIVDRTMLRTLFFHFFDFQEIKFRKDLQDMSRHIDPVTNEFIEGYSMLADMLEYPMDKYITEKEKTQSTTLISKDEVKRANRNLREVGQQIKTVRDSIKLLSEQLRNLKNRIHYVRDKLEYSDEELTILNEDVKRTEKNIAELRADLNQLEQQMKNHIWVFNLKTND